MQKVIWADVENTARRDLAGLIFRSENYFDIQVEAVASDIFERKNVKVIMIAGPSSSGKTTFSKILNEKLRKKGIMVHYIGMDDFFIDRDKVPFLPSGVRDYDSPETLDIPLLNEVIAGVLNSEWVEIPEYDFMTGRRKEEKTLLRLHGEDIVIIEGIHALNPSVTGRNDLSHIAKVSLKPRKMFIMPSGRILKPDELRLLRRTIRDFYTRGHGFESTAKQWEEVCIAENKYITPYTDCADYFVDSAFEYELFVYKQCLKGALDDCDIAEFENIKEILKEVSVLPSVQIPTASLLNEFAIEKVDV